MKVPLYCLTAGILSIMLWEHAKADAIEDAYNPTPTRPILSDADDEEVELLSKFENR